MIDPWILDKAAYIIIINLVIWINHDLPLGLFCSELMLVLYVDEVGVVHVSM